MARVGCFGVLARVGCFGVSVFGRSFLGMLGKVSS